MLFVCYTPKFPENPEPNRTNRDLGRSCSVSSRSIGCSSRFGLGLGREVKNLIGIGLNPRTDTEHRAVSVHSQAWEWNNYLIPPPTSTTADTAPAFVPNPVITARAKAFLSQSIPLKYKSSIELFTTAAQIWSSFLMRYGTKTRDDELRLEQDLLELLKLPSDTIDAHIQKFDDLLSALHAQQLATEHWDTHKVNRYFLRSLERASIPNEDWKAFSTYLGRTWHDMTLETLYSEARTYYKHYMSPLKA